MYRIMKQKFLFLSAAVLFLLTACKPDTPADKISGAYSGTYSVNGNPVGTGTATISVASDNSVNMLAEIDSLEILYTWNDVAATDSNAGSVNLAKAWDTDEVLYGMGVGKMLTFTYATLSTNVTFAGTKD